MPLLKPPTLRTVRKGRSWWIIGLVGPPLPIDTNYPRVRGTEIGPYDTKAEATEGKKGLDRFFEVEDGMSGPKGPKRRRRKAKPSQPVKIKKFKAKAFKFGKQI